MLVSVSLRMIYEEAAFFGGSFNYLEALLFIEINNRDLSPKKRANIPYLLHVKLLVEFSKTLFEI